MLNQRIGGFIVMVCLSGIAAATDFSGAWAVKGDFGSQLRYTLICIWRGADSSLAGPCVATQGRTQQATGRRSGNQLRFKYLTDYNGSGLHLEYTGVIQPDGTLKGAVNTGLSSGVFQGISLIESSVDHSTTWKMSVSISDGLQYVVVCTFKAEGERLHGPCDLTQGPTLQSSGTTEGSTVAIGYDTEDQGKTLHVVYNGDLLSDGSLKGTINAGDSVGAFSAIKQ